STLGAIHLSSIVENISTILDPKESIFLWDPNFAGIGIPALSEIIIGYFYPPNWLVVFGALLLHDPLSTIPLHTLLIFLHVGFSSIFIFKLLREHWDTKYNPALIGALVWLGIGFNLENISAAPVLFAGSYLPLLVYMILQWGKTRKKIYFAIFYIALAFSFLSGYPMVSILAYATSLLVYLFNCEEVISSAFIKKTLLHQMIGLSLISLPLIAPFYFTVVEYFPYSVRSLLPLSGFLNNSTPISFLAEIFLPKDIPDNAQKSIDIFNVFGFTGLLIIFQSKIEIFRQKRNYIILILLIFCLVISIGKVSNIAQIIYFLLPGINLFRRLSIFSIVVGFVFSIFVAQAFESATQNFSLSKITLFVGKLLLFFFLFAQSISIATLPLLSEYINPEILMQSIAATFIFGGLTLISLFLYKRTPQIAVAILISALLIEIGTGITTKVTLNSKVNPVLFFKPNVLIQRLQELVQPMDRVDMRIVQNTYNTGYLGLEQTNGYLALGSKYTSDLTQALYSDSNRRNSVRELLGISYEVVNVDA
ncbi:MAG: hypothetical protein Q8P20_07405, partial [bacterium]|nr:hypothetical protein [bacterium]